MTRNEWDLIFEYMRNEDTIMYVSISYYDATVLYFFFPVLHRMKLTSLIGLSKRRIVISVRIETKMGHQKCARLLLLRTIVYCIDIHKLCKNQ
jgi:hypothetical protein